MSATHICLTGWTPWFPSKEHITCILGGSRDSMSAYLIRGTLIALRTENAKEVLVRSLGCV